MPATENQLALDATALTAAGIGAAGPDATAIAALAEPARRALERTLWNVVTTSGGTADPFDQPGVEEAKRLAFAALGRPGYERERADLERMPRPDPHYVL